MCIFHVGLLVCFLGWGVEDPKIIISCIYLIQKFHQIAEVKLSKNTLPNCTAYLLVLIWTHLKVVAGNVLLDVKRIGWLCEGFSKLVSSK